MSGRALMYPARWRAHELDELARERSSIVDDVIDRGQARQGAPFGVIRMCIPIEVDPANLAAFERIAAEVAARRDEQTRGTAGE